MYLRVSSDEWKVFDEYIDRLKDLEEYQTIRIMFYHLFTENFFKLTVKVQVLALEFGNPSNDTKSQLDSTQENIFWNNIRNEISNLENNEIVDLINLNTIRKEAIKPYEAMFPEKGLLEEALNEFEMVKQLDQKPRDVQKPPTRITQKEVSQACRDFLNVSSAARQMQIQQINLDEDSQPSSSKKPKGSKNRKEEKRKTVEELELNSSDSDSDSEKEFKRMNRSLGYNSQNVMQGIGASKHFSEKLKKCYEKIE